MLFKTKEDVEGFIMLNIPFAIIPIKKAKTMMVSPFSSNHAKERIVKVLASKLWQRQSIVGTIDDFNKLKKYTKHDQDCPAWFGSICTCGLKELTDER